MSEFDRYLEDLPADQAEALARVRYTVAGAVPEAEEGVSYGMPAFLYRGRPLLGVRAAKGHLSVYPFSPAAVDAVSGQLDGFSLSKGTIRFTAAQPIPEGVLLELVRVRRAEIDD